MPEIDPSQVPHLPVPFMNVDHALEVRMLNEIGAALAAHQRGRGDLVAVLEKLSVFAVHTREHFLREESLMREARFPAYLVHKAEHDRALAEMNDEARAFRESGDDQRLASYLFRRLPEWFVNHMQSMDLVTARSTGSGASPPAG